MENLLKVQIVQAVQSLRSVQKVGENEYQKALNL
jgi:hypothetical protein